eukprot:GAHX01000522.1.p1 GENE.GAHX01000522.1~~GAHX01000522.1.p1  ORF type:complete len:1077 (+),score=251.53 GAHX01000522.1:459-3689(+)
MKEDIKSEIDTQTEDTNIDEGLYSRQLYVLGHDAMHRMRSQNVLVTSCTGLAVELSKNLILAGLQSVTFLDNQGTQIEDFGTNFFLYEKTDKVSSSNKRLNATIPRLSELNPHCKVNGEIFQFSKLLMKKPKQLLEIIHKYKITIMVVVDERMDIIYKANDFCNANGIKMIAANSMGLFGFVMNDFGKEHELIKASDLELATGILNHYSVHANEDNADVSNITFALIEDTKHNLNVGDLISIKELVPELQQLVGESVVISKVNSLESFTITVNSKELQGTSGNTNGSFEQQDKKQTVSMQPLEVVFDEAKNADFSEKVILTDFSKTDRTKFYFQFLEALNKAKEPVKPHKSKYTKNIIAQIDSEILKEATYAESIIRTSALQIAPINSIIGGLASQEVLKAASCKFKPIDQILFLDFTEIGESTIFNGKAHLKEKLAAENSLYRPLKSRHDHLLGVFGAATVQKFADQKGLMIGAGAIGCELLKNVALLNLFTGENGLVLIDDDTIERSNLNRQFLFREKDIEKPKAFAAKEAILNINNKIQINSTHSKFDEKYENIDKLMKSRNLLFSALDNIEARLFLDSQALFFGRPLFDSGTLGLKGNSQPIIPHISENYGASRDPEEKAIPACTLKHYPHKPEHAVHWSRDLFDGEFRAQPELANDAVTQEFNGLSDTTLDSAKRHVAFTLQYLDIQGEMEHDAKITAVVKASIDLFISLFRDNICQLLFNFPSDAKTTTGTPFWAGTKRCPVPVELDYSNTYCREFIEAATKLKCELLGIPGPDFDKHSIADLSGNYKPEEFKAENNVEIPTSDEENENHKKEKLTNAITLTEEEKTALNKFSKHATTLEFEKDNDSNGHIKFVAAASNLRMQNYRIGDGLTWHEVKKTAGRIVPAIATTTAIVAGLAVLESLKYILNKGIDDYRSVFMNLSIPMFVMSSPVEPKQTKIKVNKAGAKLLGKKLDADEESGEIKITPWDKVLIPTAGNQSGADLLISDIKEVVEEAGWKISMLTYGKFCLFSFFMNKEKVAERDEKTVIELLQDEGILKSNPSKGEFIRLEVFVEDAEGEDVDLPIMALRI